MTARILESTYSPYQLSLVYCDEYTVTVARHHNWRKETIGTIRQHSSCTLDPQYRQRQSEIADNERKLHTLIGELLRRS